MLPKDPVMLLSVINTKLRDEYESLGLLCKAYGVAEADIAEKLSGINYTYDRVKNQFI